jgi:hypothetical protein
MKWMSHKILAKTAGFGPAVKVDGDPAAWIAQASAFYDRINGLKPENRSKVAL